MTPERLLEIYGKASGLAAEKVIDRLDQHCRDFIAASPFIVLATSDGSTLDVSPKGDPAGFVAVEDDRHLILPDRPGNNRIDGLWNIMEHPQVSIIFFIPSVTETLRIKGRAEILDDPALLSKHAMKGRDPLTVTRIEVEEIFLHCGKAPLRAGLWTPDAWPATRPVGTLFEMAQDHAGMKNEDASEEAVQKIYQATLY